MKLPYSLATLWHERSRFQAGALAVAFSALLIAMQFGLLFGLISLVSTPIDRSRADLWIGYPGLKSIGSGLPVPEAWLSRLAPQPEVERAEVYLQGLVPWRKPAGGVETCMVIGARLDPDSLGAVSQLTPELRGLLSEPGAIVVDRAELPLLGLGGVGDTTEVMGTRVRVVGLVQGLKSIGASYVFCSVETGRALLRFQPDQATYLLARCRRAEDAPAVAARLREYPNMTVFTREEFSLSSRIYWLTKKKAGVALGLSALLGPIVGAVVTSQTLYGAVVASLREYAVLDALGIPTGRMAGMVLTQSFWVGVLGLAVGLPAVFGLERLVLAADTKVFLPWWLMAGTTVVTLAMALLSGLFALRSLRLIEPVTLLR
jgi:putative ABC transport system permease protein